VFKQIKSYFNIGDPEWSVRRRLVVGITFFCCGLILYNMIKEQDIARYTLMVNQCFSVITMIISVYIGGAVADKFLSKPDKNTITTSTTVKKDVVKTDTTVHNPQTTEPDTSLDVLR
jgi:hypothetical protein